MASALAVVSIFPRLPKNVSNAIAAPLLSQRSALMHSRAYLLAFLPMPLLFLRRHQLSSPFVATAFYFSGACRHRDAAGGTPSAAEAVTRNQPLVAMIDLGQVGISSSAGDLARARRTLRLGHVSGLCRSCSRFVA